jgi:hypothetical protein
MVDALQRDYVNTRAMIFDAAPEFEEILASAERNDQIVNHRI